MRAINYLILFVGGMLVQWGWSTYFHAGGISPQLLLILVIAVASEDGPIMGQNFGFFLGLFLDLMGVHLFGANTLGLTVVGYFVGTLRRQMDVTSPLSQLMVVGIFSVGYFLFLALAGLIFEKHVYWAGWAVFLITPFLNCLITPFVFGATRGMIHTKN